MRGCAAGKRNSFFILLALVATGAGSVFTPAAALAQSNVNAIICRPAAELTITSPQSDTIVDSPAVTLKGTVMQAGQIEVMVDGTFDSVIPLSSGQTSFESSVQVSQGTHTIKLKAIDSCGSNNTEKTVVVTFANSPSNGEATETETGGVTIAEASETADVQEYNPGGLLPAPLASGVNNLLNWLNIAPSDNSSSGLSQLSLGRATIITLGVYMSFIGVAQTITTAVAATPLFHRIERPDRLRVAGRTFRIIGLLMIIAAFVF